MANRFRNHHHRIAFTRLCLAAAMCAGAVSGTAQDSGAPNGQEAPLKFVDQQAGAPAVHTGRLTGAFSWTMAQLDGQPRVRDGWYPEMGGLIPGAGFSIGAGYRHRLFGDKAIVDASAATSWSAYRMLQSQLTWPSLMHDRLSIGGQVKYQDFTQINFFGIGNATLKDDQTNYRLKDVDALGFATVSATRWLKVTGRVGALRSLAIQSGTSTLHPSTGERFDEGSAPALTQQPNYLHGDVAIEADTRDVPGYPASGGRYRLSMAMFHDQHLALHSFRRMEAEAAQYVPIGRTVLSLRGRLDLSQSSAGQTVPFYMLPAIGGSSSLRGYSDYRFRDLDAMLFDAEYRWPVLRRVDAALFYDVGAVAPAIGALSGHLHADYGAGIRVHTAKRLLVRLDVARGNEGMRALVTFAAPLGLRSNRTLAPFVP